MASNDVFNEALGLDDWVWFVIIGISALFLLLLLVCCCICVRRAKRKGREEALATISADRPPIIGQPHEPTQFVPVSRDWDKSVQAVPLTTYNLESSPDNEEVVTEQQVNFAYKEVSSPSGSMTQRDSNFSTSQKQASYTLKDRIQALRRRSTLSDAGGRDSYMEPVASTIPNTSERDSYADTYDGNSFISNVPTNIDTLLNPHMRQDQNLADSVNETTVMDNADELLQPDKEIQRKSTLSDSQFEDASTSLEDGNRRISAALSEDVDFDNSIASHVSVEF